MSWKLPEQNGPRRAALAPSPLHSAAASSTGGERFANLNRAVTDRCVREVNDLYSAAVRAECSRIRLDWHGFGNLHRLTARHAELRRSGGARRAGLISFDLRSARQVLGLLVDRLPQSVQDRERALDLLSHSVDCISTQLPLMRQHISGQRPLDDGLLSAVLHFCCALGEGQSASKLFAAYRTDVEARSTTGRKLDPKRLVSPGGVRRPPPAAYHMVIHACAADRRWTTAHALRTALQIVGELESDYKPHIATLPADWSALEPTRTLAVLVERIGESAESWNTAWAELERLDGVVQLMPSQIYVMLAALRDLPTDSELRGQRAPEAEATAQENEDKRISRAITLIDMLQHGFDQKLGVNAFNALLPVMISARDSKTASMYLMNVLDRMSELKVEMSFETGVLLCDYWLRKKMYKAFVAVIEDMVELRLLLPYGLMQQARMQAQAEGNEEDATAIWTLIVQNGGSVPRDRHSTPGPGRLAFSARRSRESTARDRDATPVTRSPQARMAPSADAERAWGSEPNENRDRRAAPA